MDVKAAGQKPPRDGHGGALSSGTANRRSSVYVAHERAVLERFGEYLKSLRQLCSAEMPAGKTLKPKPKPKLKPKP